MNALHLVLIAVSCAASVLAQDPNYLAHGEFHPDIKIVLPVVGGKPGGPKWADSYSVGDRCYCYQKRNKNDYSPGIADYPVETSKGWMTVKEICDMLGPGPGASGKPIYNDIQCGNGPPNYSVDANEQYCPGRVDIGPSGCGQIGPTWKFEGSSTLPLTPPASPPPPPPPANQVYFKDLGTDSSQDKEGLLGAESTWTYGNGKSIAGTSNDKWFQTHRSGKVINYVLGNFSPNKSYRVELGFAEIWAGNCVPGARVQQIIIQNKLVKDNLDVFAAAGCFTAHLEIFDGNKAIVANSQGEIKIRIQSKVENAMLSTIQIEPATNSPPPPPSPTPSPPPPSPPTGPTKISIDAGSPQEGKTLAIGQTWTFGVPNSVEIKDTLQRPKFRTHRSAPTLRYVIPGLKAGAKYKLSLGFAEIWKPNCVVGKRIMDIKVNGRYMTRNLDVFKEAGCESAHVETYDGSNAVTANSRGQLDIEISASVENAMVSLIEVYDASTGEVTLDAGKVGGRDEDEGLQVVGGSSGRWGKSATPNQVPIEYRTHRWGDNFKFVFEGFDPNKTYDVKLGFAEAYDGNCKKGKRIFRVKINGQTVEDSLDVYDKAGGCAKDGKRLLKTYGKTPDSKGKIEIGLETIENNAMISYVEIKPR